MNIEMSYKTLGLILLLVGALITILMPLVIIIAAGPFLLGCSLCALLLHRIKKLEEKINGVKHDA